MNPLEQAIHTAFSPFAEKCFTSDAKIVKLFGPLAFGIDHLLLFKNDRFITIQDKWEKRKPNLRDIRHFIAATRHISDKINTAPTLSVFASRQPVTRRGQLILDDANKIYPSSVFVAINCSESIGALVDKVKQMIGIYIPSISTSRPITNMIMLRDYQKSAVDNFETFYLDGKTRSGVVSLPTGAGKTVVALAIIGKYWNRHPTKSVLWITERKEIIQSQFETRDLINLMSRSRILPESETFSTSIWYNAQADNGAAQNMATLMITNIDSIMYGNRYKQFAPDRYGMIILDECHSAGATSTYEMLQYCNTEWVPPVFTVGFSATPIRPDQRKFDRIVSLFGDGSNVNFISRMSLIEAVDRHIVVPPRFYWIETKLDRKVRYAQFLDNIDAEDYKAVLSGVNRVLTESKTKKAIAWARTIENAEEWMRILERASKNPAYPALDKFKLFITHTKRETNDIEQFVMYNRPCLIICVGRLKEGFDDPRVDTGINLDAVLSRGVVVFIQETGRTLRTFGNKDRGIMMDTFTFSTEEQKIEQLCNMVIGYILFLDLLDADEPTAAQPAQRLFESISVNKRENVIQYNTPGGAAINFNIVSTSLKSLDWDALPPAISEHITNRFYENGISYTDAKRIVASHRVNEYSHKKYAELVASDPRLPTTPELAFLNEFQNWADYFSIPRVYYSLTECRERISELTTVDELALEYTDVIAQLVQSDNRFPPADFWVDYYAADGINKLDDIFIIHEHQDADSALGDLF